MCKVYSYIRVSTKKQSFERQMMDIERAYPNNTIIFYQEKESGKNNERPVWHKLLRVLTAGDKVIFDSVSRMSRDAEEGAKTYFELVDRGVSLCFLNEPYINTEVYLENCKDKLQMTGTDGDIFIKAINEYFRILAVRQIRLAFAQAEKEGKDTSNRVKGGMEAKGAIGKNGKGSISRARTGRTYETAKAKLAKSQILELSKDFNGTLNDTAVMKYTKISRNSFYKYKRELQEAAAE